MAMRKRDWPSGLIFLAEIDRVVGFAIDDLERGRDSVQARPTAALPCGGVRWPLQHGRILPDWHPADFEGTVRLNRNPPFSR